MRLQEFFRRTWRLAAVAVLAGGLVACGGGNDSSAPPPFGGTGSGGSGGDTTTASATISVSLSSALVTPASASTVTVNVRDANGAAVAGAVVDLATLRGSVAVLSVASVATDASGNATATLSAAASGSSGADEVVAVAKVGETTVQGSAGFTVTANAPKIDLVASSTTLRASVPPATIRATVLDAAGNPVKNQIVNFASAAGLVTLGATSAMTDGFGTATITAAPAKPSTNGGDSIVATATTSGVNLRNSISVEIVGEVPALATTLTPSSNVTSTTPATLSVLVKGATGAAVGAGTVVSVASSFGLTVFDAATAATDATGTAKFVVSPKTADSNGADQVVVTTSVNGVAASAAAVVQVAPSSGGSTTGTPVLRESLSSTSISSASPATVTATLTDAKGAPVPGQVVSFGVVRGLATTNIATALTDAGGNAVVVLSPASTTTAGADEVTASATFAGTALQATQGFQVQATNVSLGSFTSAVASLGAYGQTTLTLAITGASVGSPVNITVTSSCLSQGKATLSPVSFTATTPTVELPYKDNGCGAIQASDKLQATITGSASAPSTLTLPIVSPAAASLAFISASPEIIYIKGSGFTETSTLIFEVRDSAGNALPGQQVSMTLLTQAGGVTINGAAAPVTQVADAAGRVSVRINSGTLPTPVRVSATLLPAATPPIATVSSNLSVAVGLPSQLNFSLAQETFNIEGFNIDGIPNTYTVILSDRNGNAVPTGTAVNFVTEGGQIEAASQTSTSPVPPKPGTGTGLSSAIAKFQSSNPRPPDGRVTITAYALGEESFIDLNGNNVYDLGEPFQDLGNIYKDRIFNGVFDPASDEYVSTGIASNSACAAPGNPLLVIDTSIPSVPGTCDSEWSGAGKVYVRRATETVLSTSAARALWSSKSGLDASCTALTLQTGPAPTTTGVFTPVRGGETWYTGAATTLSTTLPFIVADSNTFATLGPAGAVGRLNPMAAKTTLTASTPTPGVTLTIGGSPVPSTTQATSGAVAVAFDPDKGPASAVVFVNFTSPSGTVTTYAINVVRAARPTPCP